jgi:hypothetical protein
MEEPAALWEMEFGDAGGFVPAAGYQSKGSEPGVVGLSYVCYTVASPGAHSSSGSRL